MMALPNSASKTRSTVIRSEVTTILSKTQMGRSRCTCRRTRRARITRPIGSQLPKVRSIYSYSCVIMPRFRSPSRFRTVPSPEYYHRQADLCLRMALLASDYEERLRLLDIANARDDAVGVPGR